MNGLPFAFYELLLAPLAFVLTLRHARRALGAGRAAVELMSLVLYGYALERVVIAIFDSHVYGPGWRVAPAGVPLAVAVVWAALIPSALALAARLGLTSPLGRAGAAALLGVSLDLMIEPVAVRAGFWTWTPPGPWLCVPLGNFVGWTVIVGAYSYGAERWSSPTSLRGQSLRRAGLAAASVGALVAVGLLWRRLGMESLFAGRTPWLVWAAVLLATAALGTRHRWSAVGTSFAGRLGAVPGYEPPLVFLILAAAFAFHAVRLGERELVVAAVGSLLVLLLVAGGDLAFSWLNGWRGRMYAALGGVRGAVALLMKRRNGERWSEAERRFLHGELKSLLPTMLLLFLPGGILLLPFFCWLLDRRGGRRPRAGRLPVAEARPVAVVSGRRKSDVPASPA